MLLRFACYFDETHKRDVFDKVQTPPLFTQSAFFVFVRTNVGSSELKVGQGPRFQTFRTFKTFKTFKHLIRITPAHHRDAPERHTRCHREAKTGNHSKFYKKQNMPKRAKLSKRDQTTSKTSKTRKTSEQKQKGVPN